MTSTTDTTTDTTSTSTNPAPATRPTTGTTEPTPSCQPDLAGRPDPGGRWRGRRRLPVVLAATALVAVLGLGAVALIRSNDSPASAPATIGLVAAYDVIESGQVSSAVVDDGARLVTLVLDDGTEVAAEFLPLGGVDLVAALRDAGVADTEIVGPEPTSRWDGLMVRLVPMLLAFGVIAVLMRHRLRGAMGLAGRAARAEIPDVTFADVVGVDEALDDLREIVEILRHPEPYAEAGARVPKGVLLIGPPGTGKTLLAKAVAAEAGCPFFAVTGSDFVEMFAGVGARRIRNLFAAARRAQRAVVFIDEIDAVGRARGNGQASGATEEREATLNALLTEMDGFASGNIVVLAATNRADMLDAALTRAGRFDRHVHVPRPDRGGREALFRRYLRDARVDRSFDLDQAASHFARRSTGLSGADIANIVNEAKLLAVRSGSDIIDLDVLSTALERISMGRERRSTVMTELEKRIVAVHEAGHALCALVEPDVDDPMQVSIVPRGGAGGVTWLDPGEHEHFVTRRRMCSHLVVTMGGRAAEKLELDGDFTQGASSDINAATTHATRMVCEYGMSELGTIRIDPDRLAGEDAAHVRSVIAALIAEAEARADRIVADHRALLERIAARLLEQETLSRDELRSLLDEDRRNDLTLAPPV